MDTAMRALASLAGWFTVPHHDDHEVVRLAITRARGRHDPDQGGSADCRDLIDGIEARWLEVAIP